MRRTTIFLPDDLLADLKTLAYLTRTEVSHLLRQASAAYWEPHFKLIREHGWNARGLEELAVVATAFQETRIRQDRRFRHNRRRRRPEP
jgi:hypothetical protein